MYCHLVGLKTGGQNINNMKYADDTVMIADSEKKLERLLEGVNMASDEKG